MSSYAISSCYFIENLGCGALNHTTLSHQKGECYKSSLFDLIKAAIKTMVTAMVKDIN